ncbi:putative porin [Paraburkholderia sp. BL6665CI2N2]|uniref:porin n=1 Tax=Paraburkholderia sp. BL6665CI2N2 TaxID=1938806 RepID=UPI0010658D1B|nr:porin [Paraburkholderia sp. BL6665CI2N2]TDY23436.1 putative porin [Paraburkholderia sp. BL6665CI2N2]
MKKPFLSLVVLIGMPGVVHAQSNVTLYGIIDSGLNYTNNVQTARTATGLTGGRQIAMIEGGSAGLQGSRWGLKGTEDLGGGVKALFLLESGFYSNNGVLNQGGAMFGRQAYVGLSNAIGTVTLGRQYDPVVDMYGPFLAAPQWGGYMTSHPGDLDNALNSRRINNSIKFRSANYHGLTVEAMMNLGGTAGSFSNNWIWGAGAGYSNGLFSIGAGYLNIRNPNTSFFGANPNAGPATSNNLGSFGSATSPQSNPVFAGYASANRLEIAGVGAGVTLGSLNVNLAYSNTRFENLGSSSGPNTLHYKGAAAFNNAEINAKYQITPSLLAGVAFDYTRNGGAGGKGGANYNLFSAGLDYFLSKRTDVYTVAVYEKASGTDSLGQGAVAQITGLTPSTTDKQVSWRVGIRHKF